MKRHIAYRIAQIVLIPAVVFILAGCTVRTYPVVKDRVDQDLSSSAGNRGYLIGQPPAGEKKERSATRTMRVFEIELGSPVKIEKRVKPLYEEEPVVSKTKGGTSQEKTLGAASKSASSGVTSEEYFEDYTVQKGDTLQKISQKYFGTTKKWQKIFEANTDKLKAPDKIRAGQVIRVPLEKLKETGENLK